MQRLHGVPCKGQDKYFCIDEQIVYIPCTGFHHITVLINYLVIYTNCLMSNILLIIEIISSMYILQLILKVEFSHQTQRVKLILLKVCNKSEEIIVV